MNIWNRNISFFLPRKIQRHIGILRKPAVVENSYRDDILRIRRQLEYAHVHKRIGNEIGIWTVKASSFYDAFRFMFRMCDPSLVTPIKRGGHRCFEAILPESQGRLFLSDKTGNRKDTLAVMTVEVMALPDVKEIRFLNSLT